MSLFFNSLNLCKTFLNLSLFCRLHYKMCHICWDLFYFLLYIYAHLFELFLFYFERKLFIADFQCKPLIKIHVFIIFFSMYERERDLLYVFLQQYLEMVFCVVYENIPSTSVQFYFFLLTIFSSIGTNYFNVQRYKCQQFRICEEIGEKWMIYTFQDMCLAFRCIDVQTVPCTEYLHIYCSFYLVIRIYSIFTRIHEFAI